MRRLIFALSAMTLLSACGSEPSESEAVSGPAGQVGEEGSAETDATTAQAASGEDARPRALSQCIVCHTLEKDGTDGVGPNLWGVYGQAAASKEGYAYSTAMRDSGFIWDDATLDAYLENTRQALPGGKMSFGGVRNEDDRAELIAYLATLTDTPAE